MLAKMPDNFKGEYTKECGYTATAPRRWTKQEIDWCNDALEQGYSYKDIAESIDRSETSVSIKLKRLQKPKNTYNVSHLADKLCTNHEFLRYLDPEDILDVYAGQESFYKNYHVISNDEDEEANTTYHMDALKCLCHQYLEGEKFDLVDLDPYGSAYECFDLAIKIAKKGLSITLGELGHKRFKRLDFVRSHYGITKMEDFTSENLVKHIQQIGLQNKKLLKVWKLKNWKLISRVYFTIEEYKITEQWEKK